jgi:hypothetical protein
MAALRQRRGHPRERRRSSVSEPRAQAPAHLVAAPRSFVAARVRAFHPDRAAWAQPVNLYFRQEDTGWKLVGLERNR